MTSDRHVRIHSDGHCERLEAPREAYGYPKDADYATREKAFEEFIAYNRAVYKRLREKGFLSELTDNPKS